MKIERKNNMWINELNSENESVLYKALTDIMKSKEVWEPYVPIVGQFLNHTSDRIKAKALCQLGEMGLIYPDNVEPFIAQIVSMTYDKNNLIRARAVCALERIRRGKIGVIMPYFDEIMNASNDSDSEVRMNLIWASENIATNFPTVFKELMTLFSSLLDDKAIRVRMEAPEIFRVIGK